MASSTLKELTNVVLRTTGDLAELTATQTVAGASGGIGKRITDFFNLVIGKIEKESNWAPLRWDSQGTTDGINDTYEFNGADDMRAGGVVSVSIDTLGILEEVTTAQFDKLKSEGVIGGSASYFQRQISAAGLMQVQIYPLPAAGLTLNVRGYKKASKFTQPPVDTETTEFDDDLLVTGALMHIDLYDQIDRGYATLFMDGLAVAKLEAISNRQVRVTVESYK
jgi:hypothetical protein